MGCPGNRNCLKVFISWWRSSELCSCTGGEDHWSEGGVVLWAAVRGWEGPDHLAQAEQEGKGGTVIIVLKTQTWNPYKTAISAFLKNLSVPLVGLQLYTLIVTTVMCHVSPCRCCSKMSGRNRPSSSSLGSNSSPRMCLRSWYKRSPRGSSSYRWVGHFSLQFC